MEDRVEFATLASWFSVFPVDGQGVPTSDAAHALIARLFEYRESAHSIESLSEELFLPEALVGLMCEQLRTVFVLQQEARSGRYYRVSDEDRNTQLASG